MVTKLPTKPHHRIVGAAVVCICAAVLAVLWFGWSKVQPRILKSRLEAQWTSIDATQRALAGKTDLKDWSAGVFIGSEVLGTVLQRLVGYRVEYVPTDGLLGGTTVEVRSLGLVPALGHASVNVELVARNADMELDLSLHGTLSYLGVERAQGADVNDTVLARFRVEPTDVAPSARIGPLQFRTLGLWQKLAPDLAVALANPRLFEVLVPMQDRFKFDLGIDTRSTEVVNKDTKASITYQVSMPSTVIEERISYAAPIFRPEGVWLLARETSDGQGVVAASKPTAVDPDSLAASIQEQQGRLDATTRSFTGKADTAAVWVSPALLTTLASRLASLPESARRITINSHGRDGRLAETKWHDDLLGDGGAFVELVDGESASATVQLGQPEISWSSAGLRFVMPATATLKANLHFHFDPLIGGGMGTSAGVEGSGSGVVNVSAQPAILSGADGLKVAAMDTHLSCDAIRTTVTTDGVLKVDLGWIRVPKVGAKVVLPIGRHQTGALALFDNRPIFVEMPADDPRGETDTAKRDARVKKNPWAVVPPVRALKVQLVPESLVADESGIRGGVTFTAAPIKVDGSAEALKQAKKGVEKEAGLVAERSAALLKQQRPVQACTGDPEFAVLLGPVEFGSNNDIVKFAVNAWNDITKGPGPNNELVKAVNAAKKAAEDLGQAIGKVLPQVSTGGSHGGLGVTIGSWKF